MDDNFDTLSPETRQRYCEAILSLLLQMTPLAAQRGTMVLPGEDTPMSIFVHVEKAFQDFVKDHSWKISLDKESFNKMYAYHRFYLIKKEVEKGAGEYQTSAANGSETANMFRGLAERLKDHVADPAAQEILITILGFVVSCGVSKTQDALYKNAIANQPNSRSDDCFILDLLNGNPNVLRHHIEKLTGILNDLQRVVTKTQGHNNFVNHMGSWIGRAQT